MVRPWLEAGRGRLERRQVLVPTRGQAQALKQRCMVEGVPLLGVEFLTPGLAGRKWRALAGGERPAMRNELLVFGLRILVEARLAGLAPEDPTWGLWKSLLSDLERAVREFDTLLRAGFGAEHFLVPQLREVFTALMAWVDSVGGVLAPRQSLEAALRPTDAGAARTGAAVLIYGFSAEDWPDFFDLVGWARRGGDVTVVLPEPELRSERALDEGWIEMWEALLGVEAETLEVPEPRSCAGVAALWTGEGTPDASARVRVGRTRADEMALLAGLLEELVAAGADAIAVVFPGSDAAHLRLARLLAARGLPFADLLAAVGPPTLEKQLQRAVLAFYTRGARLDELLELWPLLRALNFVTQPLRAVRRAVERAFDERQTHALAACREGLVAGNDPAGREVARAADLLLPAWPESLSLAEALERFADVCNRFHLGLPGGWSELRALAERERRPLPLGIVSAACGTLLPETGPVADAPGRGRFAPITLTTRRRAAGLAWSHMIFAESNAGVWPERAESSCWLPDEQRLALDAGKRFSLGLFTADDRRLLARQAYAALARDTREEVIFTAALYEEDEPELRLAPNAWLERVLLAPPRPEGEPVDLERAFASRAQAVWTGSTAGDDAAADEWAAVWRSRREPGAPFDRYFFAGSPTVTRPAHLAARLIERGVEDPAVLWFEAVLGVGRVEWRPLVRARKKSLGQLVHRLLAQALAGPPAEGGFLHKPAPAEARHRLEALLGELRAQWPADRYWDSFHAELAETAGRLLDEVFALDAGPYLVVEASVPAGATVPVGSGGRLAVRGRMDLAFLDRPEWAGATVDIVDFKTGSEGALSAARMARGDSLQLGVYLAAAESLGARDGRVWMLKPDAGGPEAVSMAELPQALAALEQLGRHLATGCYGALTADRTEFTHGFEWPVACVPVRHAVLAQKFALTFGPDPAVTEGGDADA